MISFVTFLVVLNAAFGQKVIPNQYIVSFKEGPETIDSLASSFMTFVTDKVRAAHTNSRVGTNSRIVGSFSTQFVPPGQLGKYSIGSFRGVAIKIPAGLNITMNDLKNSNVLDIEQDKEVSLSATQTNPVWGLRRISSRDLNSSPYYTFPDSAGVGIDAYVIDTGIRTSHTQFGGRAFFGANFVGGSNSDGNGHGTHVAGTIGASTFGVAKRSTLIAVKVLSSSGSGSTSGIISGINWAVNRMTQKASPKLISVANLSLGGGISTAMDNAVASATAAGMVMVLAAGNSNVDACTSSPARAPSGITVGASASNDTIASFSNWGTCVDIFAPGVGIQSAWSTSNTATNTISGTSMAAPHVAGVVALALADYAFTTAQQVTDFIKSKATVGKSTGALKGAPNALVYNQFV